MLRRLLRSFGWAAVGLLGVAVSFYVADVAIRRQVPTSLPFGHVYVDMWNSFVAAGGTWVIDDSNSAFPVQTTELSCHRNTMTCSAAQAEIALGTLTVASYNYTASKWTDEVVVFHDDALCVSYTYTFTRSNKRVIGTRTKKDNVEGCDLVSSGALQLTLTDGFTTWTRLSDDAGKVVLPFMWAAVAAWLIFVGLRVKRVWS